MSRTPEQLAKYREAVRVKRAANLEQFRARERAYYQAHIGVKRAQLRKRNESPEGKAKKRVYNQTYYQDHQEELIAAEQQRRDSNGETIRFRACERRKLFPEKERLAKQTRRAHKNHAEKDDLSQMQWEEILAVFQYRCAYCPSTCWRCRQKKHALTQDHVTPYVQNGSNTLWNVVPSCKPCNSRKGPRPPLVPVQPLLLTLAPCKKTRHSSS